ncbi:MAG: hypothetical protein M1829_004436 [Trizodia sp. TS-e1964]|nr:MAG: hypothetical protein M1829_004436 [Trizodia sp. TS-e1964]
MDAILQHQLSLIEAALNNLIGSITSYNPSLAAAKALTEADSDLSSSLKQCKYAHSPSFAPLTVVTVSIHQANYARILALHDTADSLDSHIRTVLATLASTRSDLVSLCVTKQPTAKRDVPLDQLVAYAKHISKFTYAPRTLQSPSEAGSAKGRNGEQARRRSLDAATFAEGNAPNLTASVIGSTPADTSVSQENVEGSSGLGMGESFLEVAEAQWLNPPPSHGPFVPWPSEQVIRRGALAQIQAILESAQDPLASKTI